MLYFCATARSIDYRSSRSLFVYIFFQASFWSSCNLYFLRYRDIIDECLPK